MKQLALIALIALISSTALAQDEMSIMRYRVQQNEAVIKELRACTEQIKEQLGRFSTDMSILKSQNADLKQDLKELKLAIEAKVKQDDLPSIKEMITYVILIMLGGGGMLLGGRQIGTRTAGQKAKQQAQEA